MRFVVGHELGHVNARHAAQRQGQNMVAQAAIAGLNVAAQNSDWGGLMSMGGQIGASALLAGYSREEAEAVIKTHGGKSPGSVSARTTALVVGDAPGASKVAKAEQLGIPVLDEAGFERLLATGELP